MPFLITSREGGTRARRVLGGMRTVRAHTMRKVSSCSVRRSLFADNLTFEACATVRQTSTITCIDGEDCTLPDIEPHAAFWCKEATTGGGGCLFISLHRQREGPAAFPPHHQCEPTPWAGSERLSPNHLARMHVRVARGSCLLA